MSISRYTAARHPCKDGQMIKHIEGEYVLYKDHVDRMRAKEAQISFLNNKLSALEGKENDR